MELDPQSTLGPHVSRKFLRALEWLAVELHGPHYEMVTPSQALRSPRALLRWLLGGKAAPGAQRLLERFDTSDTLLESARMVRNALCAADVVRALRLTRTVTSEHIEVALQYRKYLRWELIPLAFAMNFPLAKLFLRDTHKRALKERRERREPAYLCRKYRDHPVLPTGPIAETPLLRQLRRVGQVIGESVRMRNCVATLLDEVAEGSLFVYRVVAPERATLVISRDASTGTFGILDLRTVNNHLPSNALREAIALAMDASRRNAETSSVRFHAATSPTR